MKIDFWKPNKEEAKKAIKQTPIFLLVLVGVTCLHYWKPSLYWNSPKTLVFRYLFGDLVTDIFGYFIAFIFFMFFGFELYTSLKTLHSDPNQGDVDDEKKS